MRPGTYIQKTKVLLVKMYYIEGDTLIGVKKLLKLTDIAVLCRLTSLRTMRYLTERYENKQLIIIYKIMS